MSVDCHHHSTLMTALTSPTLHGMVRWEPDGRGRLEQAALELYAERGFEHTTVAEIAGRAGLTERTFFRHYADKREVLFAGSSELQDLLGTTVAEPPDTSPPIDAVASGVEAIGAGCSARAATLRASPGDHRRKPRAPGARADQAGLALAPRSPRAAPPRRRRPGREPGRRGRDRRVPGRVRALDRRRRGPRRHEVVRDSFNELKAVTAA